MIDEIGQAFLNTENKATFVHLNQGTLDLGITAQRAGENIRLIVESFEKVAQANRPGLDVSYTITWEE